jgi:hypothetical protein
MKLFRDRFSVDVRTVHLIRYNLTPDIIESIFKTYPAVKKRHIENVPSKLREDSIRRQKCPGLA